MIKKKIYLIFIFLLLAIGHQSFAQKKVLKGVVKGVVRMSDNPEITILPYANIYWENATSAVTSDENGKFAIQRQVNATHKLIVSYVGYKSDTIEVNPDLQQITIILQPNSNLAEVQIKANDNGNYISKVKPLKTEIISEAGLQKLACCNLSESFEGTATVDVGYADAVSGAKRIQMLGLSGIYSQLLIETMPAIRGLASNYGLLFIPGSWMQSIQISKGTSSVINGYESITGQINVEYKKPEHASNRWFINLYGNSDAKFEANVLSRIKLNDRWSTMILGHGSYNALRINHADKSGYNDGFLDMPIGWAGNILNRWSYEIPGKGHIQFGVQFLKDVKNGGQQKYFEVEDSLKSLYYRIAVENRQYGAFLKSGLFFGKNMSKSIGIVVVGNRHELRSITGLNHYIGAQNSANLRLIYQMNLDSIKHKMSTGLSFNYDGYEESLNDSVFNRIEYVPGAFFEYTYNLPEKLNIIIGLRADYHSIYGAFFTPRVHVKWDVNSLFTIRASAGRGYRSPNVITENLNLLATSRKIYIANDIQEEIAWNYGINFVKEFLLSEDRKATIGLDIYRTDFENQCVIDLEQSPQEAHFYNLKGKSYSNSVQLDFMIQPFTGFEISLAGRYNDVKKTINGLLQESPLVSKFKGLMTLSYATRFDKWKFDVTAQLNGPSRLPFTNTNPEIFQRSTYSKTYFMLYAQVTKKFKHWDVYAGGENLTNYRQHHPIVAALEPFGKYFDASMIWGPLMGISFYAGVRININ